MHTTSDLSYMPAPPMGSMLHMKTRPPSGDGDTCFANMHAAYDAVRRQNSHAFLSHPN